MRTTVASADIVTLTAGGNDLIRAAMQDRLHQPFRSALVPGMEHVLQHGAENGALGVALSGAGPTMLALVDTDQGTDDRVRKFMQNTLDDHNIPCQILDLKPSAEGVTELTPEQFSSTFNDNHRMRFSLTKELKK